MDAHIASISRKVSSGIGVINKIKPFVPTFNLISVYRSIVEPYFDYCSIVWDDISDNLTDKLQILQNRAARVIIMRSVYNLRISRRDLALPAVKIDYSWNSFAYTWGKVWNALSEEMKYEKSMTAFKHKLESFNLSRLLSLIDRSLVPYRYLMY